MCVVRAQSNASPKYWHLIVEGIKKRFNYAWKTFFEIDSVFAKWLLLRFKEKDVVIYEADFNFQLLHLFRSFTSFAHKQRCSHETSQSYREDKWRKRFPKTRNTSWDIKNFITSSLARWLRSQAISCIFINMKATRQSRQLI